MWAGTLALSASYPPNPEDYLLVVLDVHPELLLLLPRRGLKAGCDGGRSRQIGAEPMLYVHCPLL